MADKIVELLKKLPKVDLHCHLDGSLKPKTILSIAKKQGAKLPAENEDELKKYVQVPPDCSSLTEFLKVFETFYPLLRNPEAIEEVTYSLLSSTKEDNVRYIEMRLAPALQKTDSFSQEEVIRSVIKGAEKGKKDFGISWGLILCIYRSLNPEENRQTAELAVAYYGKGVVGVDLAGDESRYPVELYKEMMDMVHRRDIPITIHAGESAGPESIRNALELGARRIGHGVTLEQDPELRKRVKEEGIPLEMCLTSNVQTRVVSAIQQHPLVRYFRDGVKVTINTDDPGVSGIDLTHEYSVAFSQLGLSLEELIEIIYHGVESSFLHTDEKERMKEDFREEIENILKKI